MLILWNGDFAQVVFDIGISILGGLTDVLPNPRWSVDGRPSESHTGTQDSHLSHSVLISPDSYIFGDFTSNISHKAHSDCDVWKLIPDPLNLQVTGIIYSQI